MEDNHFSGDSPMNLQPALMGITGGEKKRIQTDTSGNQGREAYHNRAIIANPCRICYCGDDTAILAWPQILPML
jgi:hypothetical protein